MTQQYIVGEFSSLLGRLQQMPGEMLADAVADLRREVESSPVQRLPDLAQEALDLADTICWCALEEGDADGFCQRVGAEVALGDFMLAAGLLRCGRG